MAIAIDRETSEHLSKERMRAARKVARRAARAERRAAMTPEQTRKDYEEAERQRRERQRDVINDAWTRVLGEAQEATLTALNEKNKPVKTTIDNMSVLRATTEASIFWTGIFGTERFAKPAAITVTDVDFDGRTQQRRIMVEPRKVGSHTYPFPRGGVGEIINGDPNYGVIYRAH